MECRKQSLQSLLNRNKYSTAVVIWVHKIRSKIWGPVAVCTPRTDLNILFMVHVKSDLFGHLGLLMSTHSSNF